MRYEGEKGPEALGRCKNVDDDIYKVSDFSAAMRQTLLLLLLLLFP